MILFISVIVFQLLNTMQKNYVIMQANSEVLYVYEDLKFVYCFVHLFFQLFNLHYDFVTFF